MAKRFTDTDKWKRPWFAELPVVAKLAWIYLLDDCDHRGVWAANFKRMSFDLGQKIDAPKIENWFSEKLQKFELDKYFIPSFIDFQYPGGLNKNNNAHKSIISFIETLAPNEGLNRSSTGAQDKDTDKDKDKVKDKEKAGAEKSIFDHVWDLYPNKINKVEGLLRLVNQNLTPKGIEDLNLAAENYSRYCKLAWNNWYTPMHFDVWCGAKSKSVKPWHEWIEPDPSLFIEKLKTSIQKPQQQSVVRKLELS